MWSILPDWLGSPDQIAEMAKLAGRGRAKLADYGWVGVSGDLAAEDMGRSAGKYETLENTVATLTAVVL